MNMDNNLQKIDISLKGVPRTLIMPLLGRAKFSQKPYSPIQDKLAIQLVESLNYDFSCLEKQLGNTSLYFIARAYHFDQAVKNYLRLHPNGSIVNLGAGLETAFYRVDNKKLSWIDLDLPEVIELRQKLLPQSSRVYPIAKSVLDFSWMDEVKNHGREFLFFAGGLLIYFREKEVKLLLQEMASRFRSSEFIFDTITSKGMYYANKMLNQANMSDALMQWPCDDPSQLARWSAHIQVIDQKKYFQQLKLLKGFPLLLRFRMFFYDLMSKPQIIHLKFS
ncbi:MAG: hypothetical protein A3F18_05320 [Legionellales bacterium RIFCSPHIGHO2_12_FULL_37_14]|nr:MAG: hypothetical protein A3F18_05320 [Legionellales bacterium RIFCSPHIGHO2_12_FULL_37_14]